MADKKGYNFYLVFTIVPGQLLCPVTCKAFIQNVSLYGSCESLNVILGKLWSKIRHVKLK